MSDDNDTCTVLWNNLIDIVPRETFDVTRAIGDLEEALDSYSLSSGMLTTLYLKNVSQLNKFAFEFVPFLAKFGIFGLLMLLLSLTDFLVKLLVFVTFTQIFMQTDIFYRLVSVLPVRDELKVEINTSIMIGVHDLYGTFLKIASTKFIVTWLTFDIMKLQFKFTHALLSALIGLVPVFPGFLVCVPFFLFLLTRGDLVNAIILIASQVLLESLVSHIVGEGPASFNSYITLFCLATGLYSFGILGVLYGPLIGFCASRFMHLIQTLSKQGEKPE
eukprot:CAMPEP_0204910668 /NCGR_PEP_ID=MMETSP1397-20131031/9135_1 /ASSEMBLY_ACC=CAM_ASM_000891 /TAXON_ID=49980 /ORGANISM="Climacostomum Climacostomum virens, Strain Stock W-24" /LENGTH=274 /DNA_ID=CAMNT_0052080911 /DNA_START=576 /DNA_END=1400 /DNA_ORIENTATION=+